MTRPSDAELVKLLREEALRYEAVVRQNIVAEVHGGIVAKRVRQRNEKMPEAMRRAANALEASAEPFANKVERAATAYRYIHDTSHMNGDLHHLALAAALRAAEGTDHA